MKHLKRVEIVTGALEAPKVVQILDEYNITGYTMIKNVEGRGDKGIQDGQGLHSAFQNIYLMVACSEDEVKSFTEPLRALLKKSGGVCLVSDAEWLIH